MPFHERLLMRRRWPSLAQLARPAASREARGDYSPVRCESLSVARMEVPCCAGLVRLARAAIEASGKEIPLREIVVSTRGGVKAES